MREETNDWHFAMDFLGQSNDAERQANHET